MQRTSKKMKTCAFFSPKRRHFWGRECCRLFGIVVRFFASIIHALPVCVLLIFIYRLRIQAVNTVGTGLFSHPIQFYTKELPPLPPTLNASSVSYHSVKLKWGDSSMKKSLALLTHSLQLQNKAGK